MNDKIIFIKSQQIGMTENIIGKTMICLECGNIINWIYDEPAADYYCQVCGVSNYKSMDIEYQRKRK